MADFSCKVRCKEMLKTNAMRILEQHDISYTALSYKAGKSKSGLEVANALGEKPELIYKTLVTQGHSGEYYIMVLSTVHELALKKSARAVGEKSLEMIAMKDMQKITGYIRGGCSPLGMKKQYVTVIDEEANQLDEFIVSAGKIGMQIKVNPKQLAQIIDARFAQIAE